MLNISVIDTAIGPMTKWCMLMLIETFVCCYCVLSEFDGKLSLSCGTDKNQNKAELSLIML